MKAGMGRIARLAAAAIALLCGAAAADAENRTLDLYNMNTRESLSVTYKRNGQWDEQALRKLDWFLRDWRRGESTTMDRRLYDVIWNIREQAGTKVPVHVHSGYRSPATNAMLRTKSRAVARHSQHIKGNALDFHLPGVPAKKLREIALKMQDGGVGYYPGANNPFIHVDVGEVRHWPRMSRQQLSALFPDGMTLHVPADGKPLKGFRDALALISSGQARKARGPSAVLASLAPSSIPLPEPRPDPEARPSGVPSRAFAVLLGLDGAGEDGPLEAASAFLPSMPGTASGAVLKPSRTVPPSMAVIRKPLDSPAEALGKAGRVRKGPILVDMGVGKKGDRLARASAENAASAKDRWKIGGLL